MAFGLLLERFDLLLLPVAEPAAPRPIVPGLGRTAGLLLILLGVLVLGVSTSRYLHFKQLIASQETRDFRASRTDLVLLAIVALIGVAMSVYVAAQALR